MAGSAHIVAPVCRPEEVAPLVEAGADELYCGILPAEWIAEYGESDQLSRRQGRDAHAQSLGELAEIGQAARKLSIPAALTLNVRYTRSQLPKVLDLADAWSQTGGGAIVLSDIGLMLQLKQKLPELSLHVSVLANVLNSSSAVFFAELGADRIVLPRELTIPEIGSLIRHGPTMEYETIAMYQKCEFVDGLCFFHHGVRLPSDVPGSFTYTRSRGSATGCVRTHDPDFEGHGCQLAYQTADGRVIHLQADDFRRPHCAACGLSKLRGCGVRFFKIAGRGYGLERVATAARFLKSALEHTALPEVRMRSEIQREYEQQFKHSCEAQRCYYPS